MGFKSPNTFVVFPVMALLLKVNSDVPPVLETPVPLPMAPMRLMITRLEPEPDVRTPVVLR